MRKVVWSIAIAAAVAASPARATNGIRMIGFGPVQDSMGGVGVGATLDAASVVTNPAGVADLGGRVDFGAAIFGATVKYTAADDLPALSSLQVVVNDGQEYTSDRRPTPVPAFGIVLPITDTLKFAVGAYGIAGLATEWKANVLGSPIYSEYSQLRFSPGLGWKLHDLLSVGASFNLLYSNLGYSIGSPGAQVTHTTTSAFGFSGTLGVTVKPLKILSIGAAYEFQGSSQDFEWNTPPGYGIVGVPCSLGGCLTTAPVNAGRDKLSFKTPQIATVGASVRPIEMLLVAADVQWINWSGVLGDDKPPYTQNQSGSLPFDLGWKDQWVFKIGAQIDAGEAFKVRVGYNYAEIQLDESKALQNIAFPAIAEQHITAGVTWQATPKLAFLVGGMYSPEAKLSGTQTLPFATGLPAPNDGVPVNVSYTTKMTQYAVDLGLTYAF
jgi:long-chain fatty acid transport protein